MAKKIHFPVIFYKGELDASCSLTTHPKKSPYKQLASSVEEFRLAALDGKSCKICNYHHFGVYDPRG